MFAYDSETAGLSEVFSWDSIHQKLSCFLKSHISRVINSAIPQMERKAEPFLFLCEVPENVEQRGFPLGMLIS